MSFEISSFVTLPFAMLFNINSNCLDGLSELFSHKGKHINVMMLKLEGMLCYSCKAYALCMYWSVVPNRGAAAH